MFEGENEASQAKVENLNSLITRVAAEISASSDEIETLSSQSLSLIESSTTTLRDQIDTAVDTAVDIAVDTAASPTPPLLTTLSLKRKRVNSSKHSPANSNLLLSHLSSSPLINHIDPALISTLASLSALLSAKQSSNSSPEEDEDEDEDEGSDPLTALEASSTSLKVELAELRLKLDARNRNRSVDVINGDATPASQTAVLELLEASRAILSAI